MTTDTITTQLNHRSIREYTQNPVDESTLHMLFDVAKRTATSQGLQLSSIITITSPQLKEKISQICGQEYISRAPQLWIFLVDAYRACRVYEEATDHPYETVNIDIFFQGFTDACLTAQNVATAAESQHLGTCFLGSILNDIEKLIEVLNLPKYTFPALGLIFGHPNQEPELKPRMPIDYRMFSNSYQQFDNYHKELSDYDDQMQTYYDLRNLNRRLDAFTTQLVRRLSVGNPKRNQILAIAQKQGFELIPSKD